jgi:NADH-quinone oxidoreductase subunit J
VTETDFPLFYSFHFYLFGVLAVGSALLFVTRKSPVAAALWLVNVMFCLAAMYVLLDAHFVGIIQVLVYAGAIMVVFIFVVMLLNLGHASSISDLRPPSWRLAGLFVGLLLSAEILVLLRQPIPSGPPIGPMPDNVIHPVASALFTRHLLAFEVTSVLLLAAIVGAVVLAKRSSPAPRGLTKSGEAGT